MRPAPETLVPALNRSDPRPHDRRVLFLARLT